MVQILKNADFVTYKGGLAVDKQDPQPPCPPHKHEFSEIAIVKSGSGVHSVGNCEYPITAGDVFVIMGNTIHSYSRCRNLCLINLLYDNSQFGMEKWNLQSLPGYREMFLLEPAFRRVRQFESRLKIRPGQLAYATELCAKLDSELKSRKGGFQIMAESIFKELVVFLSREYKSSSRISSEPLFRISKAMNHIEEFFRSQIDIDTLATIANMSRRNFQRVFTAAVGMSPIDYILHVRLMHSAEMLKLTDISITQVAFASGFKDSNYFSRQFKNKFSHTPRLFRSIFNGIQDK